METLVADVQHLCLNPALLDRCKHCFLSAKTSGAEIRDIEQLGLAALEDLQRCGFG
jgi:hypothetical protein